MSVLDSIRDEIKGIGESLKEIFTDPEVVDAGNRFLDSMAYNLGRVSGSVVSIGLTIADNLLGGIDLYLDQNKDRTKISWFRCLISALNGHRLREISRSPWPIFFCI